MSTENADEILGTYKRMMADCQQIATKISEVWKSPSHTVSPIYRLQLDILYICLRHSLRLKRMNIN